MDSWRAYIGATCGRCDGHVQVEEGHQDLDLEPCISEQIYDHSHGWTSRLGLWAAVEEWSMPFARRWGPRSWGDGPKWMPDDLKEWWLENPSVAGAFLRPSRTEVGGGQDVDGWSQLGRQKDPWCRGGADNEGQGDLSWSWGRSDDENRSKTWAGEGRELWRTSPMESPQKAETPQGQSAPYLFRSGPQVLGRTVLKWVNWSAMCRPSRTSPSEPARQECVCVPGVTICATGRVRAVVLRPPCRTVSSLRCQGDGGPGVLSDDANPYGRPDLAPSDMHGLGARWCHTLVSRPVAVHLGGGCTWATRLTNTAGSRTTWRPSKVSEDPGCWAAPLLLRVSNQRMATVPKPLWHQYDPLRPAPHGSQEEETNNYCDQYAGTAGAQRHPWGAREWAESFWGLQIYVFATARPRVENIGNLGSWFWRRQLRQHWTGTSNGWWVNLRPRRNQQMRPLNRVALEAWKNHFLNDHLPARRDCAQCTRAQARSRPHQKVMHPEAYTLSVDLSGRMTAGQDQEHQRRKYLMVACYTFPVTGHWRPLVNPPGAPSDEQDHPLPAMDLSGGEGTAANSLPSMDLHGGEGSANHDGVHDSDEVFMDDEGDQPPARRSSRTSRAGWSTVGRSSATSCIWWTQRRCDAGDQVWHKMIEEATNVGVKNLTLVELLSSRSVSEVMPALARIHARLQALGLPVLRFHCDRARELVAAPVRRWTLDRGIITTLTSGSTYKSNGRVEGLRSEPSKPSSPLGCAPQNFGRWPRDTSGRDGCATSWRVSGGLPLQCCGLAARPLHFESHGKIATRTGETPEKKLWSWGLTSFPLWLQPATMRDLSTLAGSSTPMMWFNHLLMHCRNFQETNQWSTWRNVVNVHLHQLGPACPLAVCGAKLYCSCNFDGVHRGGGPGSNKPQKWIGLLLSCSWMVATPFWVGKYNG